MRRVIDIACDGDVIVGTLDEGSGDTGLLIVSGGNEIRAGAHRGMALLAQALAAEGVPVLRYDRRGIGDSTGENRGFEGSAEDVAAAAAALRRETGVARVIGFGNCDAASALALFHAPSGIDALLLSNPWAGGGDDDALPPAAAIRARYAQRLRDPREWLRLARGGVNIAKLVSGLWKVVGGESDDTDLIDRMAASLAASRAPATILLAEHDNTAVAFRAAWGKAPRPPASVVTLDSASHSYAGAGDAAWLLGRVRDAIGAPVRHDASIQPPP